MDDGWSGISEFLKAFLEKESAENFIKTEEHRNKENKVKFYEKWDDMDVTEENEDEYCEDQVRWRYEDYPTFFITKIPLEE